MKRRHHSSRLKPARLPSIDYIFEKNAVTPPPPNPSRRRPMQKKNRKKNNNKRGKCKGAPMDHPIVAFLSTLSLLTIALTILQGELPNITGAAKLDNPHALTPPK